MRSIHLETISVSATKDLIYPVYLPDGLKMVSGVLLSAQNHNDGIRVSWKEKRYTPTVMTDIAYNFNKIKWANEANKLGLLASIQEEIGEDLFSKLNKAKEKYIAIVLKDYCDLLRAYDTDDNVNHYTSELLEQLTEKFMQNGIDKLVGDFSAANTPYKKTDNVKIYDPNILKEYYKRYINDLEFYDVEDNFNENYLDATIEYNKIGVCYLPFFSQRRVSSKKVNVFETVSTQYGTPEQVLNATPIDIQEVFMCDNYKATVAVLNAFIHYITTASSVKILEKCSYDTGDVGFITLGFDNGSELALQDISIALNTNAKSIHKDIIPICQVEEEGSYVNVVFKNNDLYAKDITFKIYFFYELIDAVEKEVEIKEIA